MDLNVANIESFPNGLAISWNDKKDSFIDYKILRDQCPCANCSGESDVFGNLYKGPEIKLTENAYRDLNIAFANEISSFLPWSIFCTPGIEIVRPLAEGCDLSLIHI